MGLIRFFRGLLRAPGSHDGMGQGLLTDLLWIKRFRALRRRSVVWSVPDADEKAAWQLHPKVSKFGDFLIAVTDIDARRCWIVERIWHGWPDPPEFAFFALDRGGEVWAAADFHHWPVRWSRPMEPV
ncbi:MAG: hypothetical protein AAF415_03090 [Pseudomonadota bacterium]